MAISVPKLGSFSSVLCSRLRLKLILSVQPYTFQSWTGISMEIAISDREFLPLNQLFMDLILLDLELLYI
jgi:hypothetical protein